ncbi:MAG TPA: zf-HC2 domain-containing protein [Pyrinomonadaceae bacterium]|jgi:hypothetical protein|nr:zf-HC2 domain-containing protein [Pyrinomonadaceae bacterium]
MNCEKCQDLLSDFLDGALSTEDSHVLGSHLEECLSCLGARDDLESIVSFCRECREEYVSPPNERALWLRIRNIIESEPVAAAAALPSVERARENWWARLMNRSWELSLPQLTAAITAIAIAVSLATAFSLQQMQGFGDRSASARDESSSSSARSSRDKAGAPTTMLAVDDRVRHQQMEIDYWNKRIQQQMARWSPQTRQSFERNLNVINQAVADSRNQLLVSPHDEVSEEMLNSALNEKMQLLKEFSDL